MSFYFCRKGREWQVDVTIDRIEVLRAPPSSHRNRRHYLQLTPSHLVGYISFNKSYFWVSLRLCTYLNILDANYIESNKKQTDLPKNICHVENTYSCAILVKRSNYIASNYHHSYKSTVRSIPEEYKFNSRTKEVKRYYGTLVAAEFVYIIDRSVTRPRGRGTVLPVPWPQRPKQIS